MTSQCQHAPTSQNVSEFFSVRGIAGIAGIAKQLGLKALATNVSSEAMRSIDAICAVTRCKEFFLDLCLYLVRHCSISQLDALESTPSAKEQRCNGEISEISPVLVLMELTMKLSFVSMPRTLTNLI